MGNIVSAIRNLDIRKVAWVIGFLTMCEAAVLSGQITFDGILSPHAIDVIKTLCKDFIFINGALLVGHTTTAVKWPEPPAGVKAAIAALALLILLGAADARAASKKPAPTLPPLSLTIPCIGNTKLPLGCKPPEQAEAANASAVANALARPFQDLANFVADDSTNAIKLSTQIPELQDGNGQACWMVMQSFSAVWKAHPIPATFKLESDLEALRLVEMAANKVCASSACTQVFADLTNTVQAASPVSIVGLPSLNALCSKVPQIAAVPPVTPAPALPAPTGPQK